LDNKNADLWTGNFALLSLLEFYVATTRVRSASYRSLLSPEEARTQIHDMVIAFEVLYPAEAMMALTLLESAVHGLS
jgi:hypothetical protein